MSTDRAKTASASPPRTIFDFSYGRASTSRASENAARHLVVLQHGFGGTTANMLSIYRSISSSLPGGRDSSRVKLLNVSSNEGIAKCREGIRTCGERLFEDIMHALVPGSTRGMAGSVEAEEPLAFTELSIIGYSAGGLFARYAVGMLEACGVLSRLHCAAFITLATPHLGCIRPSDGTWRTAVWNQGGGMLDKMTKPLRPKWMDGGVTLEQLFLRDAVTPWFDCAGRAQPALLEAMALPGSSYIQGLSRFTQLCTVANARADRTVPCETAAILPVNPFHSVCEEKVTAISAEYPHVAKVMPEDEAREMIAMCVGEQKRYYEEFGRDAAGAMQRMVDGLSTLHWQRVFAWLPGEHTHGSVIARQWNESPEEEAHARASCGQDVVAFTSSAVRASVLAS